MLSGRVGVDQVYAPQRGVFNVSGGFAQLAFEMFLLQQGQLEGRTVVEVVLQEAFQFIPPLGNLFGRFVQQLPEMRDVLPAVNFQESFQGFPLLGSQALKHRPGVGIAHALRGPEVEIHGMLFGANGVQHSLP